MKYTAYFPFLAASALLVLAGVFHSASFAAVSVVATTLAVVRELFLVHIEAKNQKQSVPDETKRKLDDLAARVTSIEVGIQRRGF